MPLASPYCAGASEPSPVPPAAPTGEVLLGDLYRAGFDVVPEHEDADAVIVNTCGFVEDAKTESLEVGRAVGRRARGPPHPG